MHNIRNYRTASQTWDYYVTNVIDYEYLESNSNRDYICLEKKITRLFTEMLMQSTNQ